ncbi:hypothetical protein VNO77_15330 [Canavalia gladiata]|uniref:Uncharacterized protein n=1 Tax=Canavalia gladiata TaxID=3824 RepID=A0AAN9LZG1_CANGL
MENVDKKTKRGLKGFGGERFIRRGSRGFDAGKEKGFWGFRREILKPLKTSEDSSSPDCPFAVVGRFSGGSTFARFTPVRLAFTCSNQNISYAFEAASVELATLSRACRTRGWEICSKRRLLLPPETTND